MYYVHTSRIFGEYLAGEEEGMDLKSDHVLQNYCICQILHLKDQHQGEIEEEKVSVRTALVDNGYVDGTYNNGGGGSDADACLKGMTNPNEYLASPTKKAKIGRA